MARKSRAANRPGPAQRSARAVGARQGSRREHGHGRGRATGPEARAHHRLQPRHDPVVSGV